jgi:folate-binding Fe-S cluster repair protein YgfZ
MSADDLTTTTTPVSAPPPAKTSALAKAGIATAVVVLLVVGAWLYGRSSTAPDRAAADATRLRMMLFEARTQVLDAQLSLYTANFGNAAQHLEYAKPPLTAASTELTRLGNAELATKADAAMQHVTTARDLAAKLSLEAGSKPGEASKLLGEVSSALPR